MGKKISRKEYEKMERKVQKMNFKLQKLKQKNPKSFDRDKKFETATNAIKLNVIYSVIGYLESNKEMTGISLEVLKDVARDYQKKVRESQS